MFGVVVIFKIVGFFVECFKVVWCLVDVVVRVFEIEL